MSKFLKKINNSILYNIYTYITYYDAGCIQSFVVVLVTVSSLKRSSEKLTIAFEKMRAATAAIAAGATARNVAAFQQRTMPTP